MKRLASIFALCLLAGCTAAPPPPDKDPFTATAYIRAVGYLQLQSHSPDWSIRANCIESLQLSPDPRAQQVVQRGLRDEEWVVRFAAAMACGKRKVRAALPTLDAMAKADTNGSARAAAIFALKEMDRPAHMSDLAALLRDPDPSTRANTALVLGTLKDKSAIPLLETRRNELDIRVRFEITAALARLGDDASQKIIVGWAVNRYAEDQWNAMVVCGDLPPTVAANPLLLGIEPAPPKLPPDTQFALDQVKLLITRRQLVAARSLAQIRIGQGERIAAIAIEQLNPTPNPNPTLRALALLALGEMMTPDLVRGLELFLGDPDDGVRRAAAAAIINVYTRANTRPN